MTISGLLLVLISVTYPPWLLHKSRLALYDAERDSELLELDLKAEEDQYKEIGFILERLDTDREQAEDKMEILKNQIKPNMSPSEKAAIRAELDHITSLVDGVDKELATVGKTRNEAARNVDKKRIELRYKLKVSLWENRTGQVFLVLCLLGAAAGMLIGVKGFNDWSLRVQVHQDAILRNQAMVVNEYEMESSNTESEF